MLKTSHALSLLLQEVDTACAKMLIDSNRFNAGLLQQGMDMLKHALGSTLLVSATQVLALSLGGTQGGAIIGRPMEVLVSSSIDAADAATGLCLEAEVLYGETPVPASAVTVAVHKLGSDGQGQLRVRTTVPVNEPIVTLKLKAGCQSPFRRSYTLLADFDSAPAVSPVVTSSRRDVTAPVAVGRVNADASTAPERSSGKKTDRKAAPIVVTSSAVAALEEDAAPALGPETPVRLESPAKRPGGVLRMSSKTPVLPRAAGGQVGEIRQSVASPAGARLQLEAIDLADAPASPETPAVDTSAPTQSTDALAATAAESAKPEQALQQEIKSLREEQERLRLAVESMNAQLSQAQSGRYSNPLIYGLGLGVVGLLGAVVFLLRRQKQKESADSWWNSSLMPVDSTPSETPGGAAGQHAPVASALDAGLNGLEAKEAGLSVFHEVPVSQVKPQELLDLWEQADFLVSIGQELDALNLLEAFVQSHPRASEAPYLRWLQLASEVGNAAVSARAQSVYEQHYHRLVPTVQADAPGLEDQGGFLQELSQAWPGASARDQIDALLFSQPGDASLSVQRSLKLFDDLLSLRRLLNSLDALPPATAVAPAGLAVPVVSANAAAAVASALPVGTESDTAEWLSIGEPAEEKMPAPSMLEMDFSAPPVVLAPAETPEQTTKPELPPLDFDFFEFDPQTGDSGKKAG